VLNRKRVAELERRIGDLSGDETKGDPGRLLPQLLLRSFRRVCGTGRRLGMDKRSGRELRHLVDFFTGVYGRLRDSRKSLLDVCRKPLEALGVETEELHALHFDADELDRLRSRTDPLSSAEAIRLSWHLVRTCWSCRRVRVNRFVEGAEVSAHPDADPLLQVALEYRQRDDPRVVIRQVLDRVLLRSTGRSVLGEVFRTGLRIVPAAAEPLRGNRLSDVLALFHLAVARGYARSAETKPPESAKRIELLEHALEETELGVCLTNLGSWRDAELRSRGYECYAEAFWLAGLQLRALEAQRQAVRVLGNRGSLPTPRELDLLMRLARWNEERGDSGEAYRVFREVQQLIEQRRVGAWLREEVEAGVQRTQPDSVKLGLMEVRVHEVVPSEAPANGNQPIPPSRPGPGLLGSAEETSPSEEPGTVEPIPCRMLRRLLEVAKEQARGGGWLLLHELMERLLAAPLTPEGAEELLAELCVEGERAQLRESARPGVPWDSEHCTAEELRQLMALPRLPASAGTRLARHLVVGCQSCCGALREVESLPEGAPAAVDPVVRALRNTLPSRQDRLAPMDRWAVRELHAGRPLGYARLLLVEGLRSAFGSGGPFQQLVTAFADVPLAAAERLGPRQLADLRALWCLHKAEVASWIDPAEAVRVMVAADAHLAKGSGDRELQATRLEVRARVDAAAGRLFESCEQLRAAAELLAPHSELTERRAGVLSELGNFLNRGGWSVKAREALQEGVELVERLGPEVSQPVVLTLHHHLAAAESRLAVTSPEPAAGLAAARGHLAAVASLYDAYANPPLLAERDLLIGRIEHDADPARAEAAYRRAVARLEELGLAEPALEVRLALAALLLDQGRCEEVDRLGSEIRRAASGSVAVGLHLVSCRRSFERVAEEQAGTPLGELARRQVEALTWISEPAEVQA